ncbi:hypothetical protein ABT369_28955 [Dactylosporangium sp. NPDC000244]|uniref:hypothetical protein n=1 Tax=Dactylosporangium sp. NPDC000244 TaxID=3154365 RepID=UPI00331F2F14
MNRPSVRLSMAVAAIALAGLSTAACSGDDPAESPDMVPAGATSSLKPSPTKQSKPKGDTKIVEFKIVQQPKCPEGTAVYRADAVPVIIKWKVTGATGIGLSVDNPDLPGSYGNYPASGTETFTFSCGGPVGSVETHTYTITTTGGKQTKKAQVKASAKVMDTGRGGN